MNIWSTNTYYGSGILVIGSDNNLYRSLSKNIGLDPTTHSDIWQAESSEGTPITPNAGGGSSGQGYVVHKAPFTFDLTGLATGVEAPFTDGYVPSVGDLLINGWINISVVWVGTTPQGDWGQIGVYGPGPTYGLWNAVYGAALGMGQSDVFPEASLPTLTGIEIIETVADNMTVSGALLQGKFTTVQASWRAGGIPFPTADPIKIVVSSDGTTTGGDPASTQGAAVLYVATYRF